MIWLLICSFPPLQDGLPQLIFSNGQDVMMADVHGRLVRTLAQSENKGRAMGVAFHWHSQRAFWTDTVNKKVCRDAATAFGFHQLASVTLKLNKKSKMVTINGKNRVSPAIET